jgi:integrase
METAARNGLRNCPAVRRIWSDIARGLAAAPRQRQRAPTRTRYSLRELRDRALVGVAYDTLARSAEVVALKLTDFHLESRTGRGRPSSFARRMTPKVRDAKRC